MKTTLIVADFRYDYILPCLARYSAASSDLSICGKKTVLKENINEIWLASEDTGAYGIDLGTDISFLLKSLSKSMEEC